MYEECRSRKGKNFPARRVIAGRGNVGDVEDIEANTKVAESHCRESNRWGKTRGAKVGDLRIAKISEMRTETR